MALNAISFFLLIAGLIFSGIASLLIFSRFKITDVAVLLLIGIVIGQGLHLANKADFEPYMSVIGSFTLAMVLFNESLNLSVKELKDIGPKVLIFSLFVYFVCAGLITVVAYLIDPVKNLFQSVVIGIALGAVGPSVVLPVLHGVRLDLKVKKFLVMNAVIEDTIALLLITAMLGLGVKSIADFTPDIVSRMLNMAALSVFVGLGTGILWIGFLRYYRQRFDYMLALGTMLLTYAAAGMLGANGNFAVFALGFVMSNMNAEKMQRLRGMHDEVTFLVKTFFFVYLGILFDFSLLTINMVFTSLAIVAPMIIARFAGIFVFNEGDAIVRPLMAFVIGRGVGVAVMVILITNSGLVTFPSFVEISFLVILLTSILSTVGVYMYEKRGGFTQTVEVGTVQANILEGEY